MKKALTLLTLSLALASCSKKEVTVTYQASCIECTVTYTVAGSGKLSAQVADSFKQTFIAQPGTDLYLQAKNKYPSTNPLEVRIYIDGNITKKATDNSEAEVTYTVED